MNAAHGDRRRARRYPIVAPVKWDSGEGQTENVSSSGLYFSTPRALAVGQSLEITVTLPRQAIPVRGQGTVVRVEARPDGGFGVGVRLDVMEPVPFKAG